MDLNKLKKLRIPENRDMIWDLKLSRNEKVKYWEKHIFKNFFSKIKKHQLGTYHDNSRIYKSISNFFDVKEENLLVTSGIDEAIKTIWEKKLTLIKK